jgi:hypothetical protein
MLLLKDVSVSYMCPKCKDPVSVYWYLARIPINRLGLAIRKDCDKLDCKRTPLKVLKISGDVERSQP